MNWLARSARTAEPGSPSRWRRWCAASRPPPPGRAPRRSSSPTARCGAGSAAAAPSRWSSRRRGRRCARARRGCSGSVPTAGDGGGQDRADLVGVPDDLPQRRHAGDFHRAGAARAAALSWSARRRCRGRWRRLDGCLATGSTGSSDAAAPRRRPSRSARARARSSSIATMGVDDEEALEAALRSGAGYVALVASPRRAAVLRDYLAARGVTAGATGRTPGARRSGHRRARRKRRSRSASWPRSSRCGRRSGRWRPSPPVSQPPVEAHRPGLRDDRRDRGRHVTRPSTTGTTWYFCCGGCKAEFERAPQRFAVAAG